MEFEKINPNEINKNPFDLISKDWALVAAQKDGKVNALTASWGGVGVLWNKNVVFIFIRNSRYTKEFLDSANTFSLTFFNHEKYAETYKYFGSVSGRNEDKIAKQGLTVARAENTPYFAEGKLAVICKKLSAMPFAPNNFTDSNLLPAFYGDNDMHVMYIGEIVSVLHNGANE